MALDLATRQFQLVICDESHSIKDSKASTLTTGCVLRATEGTDKSWAWNTASHMYFSGKVLPVLCYTKAPGSVDAVADALIYPPHHCARYSKNVL